MSDGHEGVEDTWEVVERALSDGTRCKMEDMNKYIVEVERVIMSGPEVNMPFIFPMGSDDDWVFEPF